MREARLINSNIIYLWILSLLFQHKEEELSICFVFFSAVVVVWVDEQCRDHAKLFCREEPWRAPS